MRILSCINQRLLLPALVLTLTLTTASVSPSIYAETLVCYDTSIYTTYSQSRGNDEQKIGIIVDINNNPQTNRLEKQGGYFRLVSPAGAVLFDNL